MTVVVLYCSLFCCCISSARATYFFFVIYERVRLTFISLGNGWYYAAFAIYDRFDTSRVVVNYAMDGFCQYEANSANTRDICLPVGCYTLEVGTSARSSGVQYDATNTWSFCGMSGAGNSRQDFCIASTGVGTYSCERADSQPTFSPTSRFPSLSPSRYPSFTPTRKPSAFPTTRAPSVARPSARPSTRRPTAPTARPTSNAPVVAASGDSTDTDAQERGLYIGVAIGGALIVVSLCFLFYYFYARNYSTDQIIEHVGNAPGKLARGISKRAVSRSVSGRRTMYSEASIGSVMGGLDRGNSITYDHEKRDYDASEESYSSNSTDGKKEDDGGAPVPVAENQA
jgi:hypothetical protein